MQAEAPSFLTRVADAVLETAPEGPILDLSQTAVVFPNRRAGVFFGQALAARAGRALWAPSILTVGDLLRRTAPELTVADPVAIVILLHQHWQALGSTEPLDQFYTFGQRLAEDFDDIDRHLADPEQVLRNLSELRALEGWAGLGDEELATLREFWAMFSNTPLRTQQAAYLAQFDRLLPLYQRYTAELAQRGWTTEARLARQLAQRLRTAQPQDDAGLPRHIVFAGLGALAEAERVIIERLVRRGRARVLVDADAYYTTTLPHHEARRALEPQLVFALGPGDVPARIGHQALDVEVISAAQPTGVARAAGQVLARWLAEGSLQPLRTAVLLADEGLLFDVLQHLPASIATVNVTMGYPLWQTAIVRLMRAVAELQLRAWRDSAGQVSGYPLRPLIEVLQHPYAQLADAAYAEANGLPEPPLAAWLRRAQHEGWTYSLLAELPQQRASLHQLLLAPLMAAPTDSPHTGAPLIDHLMAVGLEAQAVIAAQAAHTPVVDLEAVFTALGQLQRLNDLLKLTEAAPPTALDAQWRLVRQVMQATRLPFSGEPLEGLQVMGMLESRALEFDSIIVCSANEGILPRPTTLGSSMLPYTLRRAFGLPTPDLTDAVSSYNFWRLLHGAKRCVLITDAVGADGTGSAAEPSRYIHQLRYELAATFSPVTLHERVAAPPIPLRYTPDYTEAKTPEVLTRLQALAEGQFSPTQLQTYVACPMRFYYRYVQGLHEAEALSETLDARQFGNVLHTALELLYTPLVGVSCTAQQLTERRSAVSAAVTQAAEAEPALRHNRLGKNHLLLRVITRLAEQVLSIDEARANEHPIVLEALEHEMTRTLTLPDSRAVGLRGRADRIERWGRARVVIDYKTGGVTDLSSKLAPEQVLERLFTTDDHPEALQALLYAYLLNDDAAMAAGQLHVMIYPMRRLSPGGKTITAQGNVAVAWPQFEARLQGLVGELMDPAVPFVQKKDERRCSYCPYHRLCYGL